MHVYVARVFVLHSQLVTSEWRLRASTIKLYRHCQIMLSDTVIVGLHYFRYTLYMHTNIKGTRTIFNDNILCVMEVSLSYHKYDPVAGIEEYIALITNQYICTTYVNVNRGSHSHSEYTINLRVNNGSIFNIPSLYFGRRQECF